MRAGFPEGLVGGSDMTHDGGMTKTAVMHKLSARNASSRRADLLERC
jgi:hypothetical protein